MNNYLRDFAKKRFEVDLEALPEPEQRVIHHYGERRHISRDTNREFEKKLTFGQRLADQVAMFGGSWTFILIFAATLLAWVLLNSFILARRGDAFDPYPYILLNLFLSMLAAIQAPVILMSQSRKAAQGQQSENRLSQEVQYGFFARTFTLPEGVMAEELQAHYHNGVLEVTVPLPRGEAAEESASTHQERGAPGNCVLTTTSCR